METGPTLRRLVAATAVTLLAAASALASSAPVQADSSRSYLGWEAEAMPEGAVLTAARAGELLTAVGTDPECEAEAARSATPQDCSVTYSAKVTRVQPTTAEAEAMGIEPVGAMPQSEDSWHQNIVGNGCYEWWQEKSGGHFPTIWNWSERHTGRTCFAASGVSATSHTCDRGSSGRGVTVTIAACYGEQPNSNERWQWDYFSVQGDLNRVHYVMRSIARLYPGGTSGGEFEFRWCNDCP